MNAPPPRSGMPCPTYGGGCYDPEHCLQGGYCADAKRVADGDVEPTPEPDPRTPITRFWDRHVVLPVAGYVLALASAQTRARVRIALAEVSGRAVPESMRRAANLAREAGQ